MPVLTYDKADLLRLIGRRLSDERLREVVELIKPEVESIGKKEVVLELTPERPDLFGVEGLARAIRAYLGIETGLPKYSVAPPKLVLRVEEVSVRPFVACAVVRKLKLTNELIESLMSIQEALHQTIGRNRRKVAIGLHDFDKIVPADTAIPTLTYTQTKPEARMQPLDGEEMSLREIIERTERGKAYGHLVQKARLWPVYVDAAGIFSFPPVINSERTRVTSRTKNLFIELTGTDEQAVHQTLCILVTNLAERKARVETVQVRFERAGRVEHMPKLVESAMDLKGKAVNELLGLTLSLDEIGGLLERMGFGILRKGEDELRVLVPPYRVDVLHEVDLIEDIAIAYGYNNLTPELPAVATIGRAHPLEELCDQVRRLMIGLGFQEVLRPILTNPKHQFELMGVKKQDCIEILNPVSSLYTCLRTWMIPGLMQMLAVNKHAAYPQRIFEIGDVVLPDPREEVRSRTLRKVAGVISHKTASFSEAKSVVESLLRNLGVRWRIEELSYPCFIEGRAASLRVGKQIIGMFGEIHPQVLKNWRLEMPVGAFELDVESLA